MEYFSDLMHVDAARLSSALSFVTQMYHSVLVWEGLPGFLFLSVIALGVATYVKRQAIMAWPKRLRERRLMNHKHLVEERSLLADIFTDGLEEELHKGRKTREEVLAIYQRWSNLLPDLVPREKRLKAQLEEARAARIAADKAKEAIAQDIPKKSKLQAANFHIL